MKKAEHKDIEFNKENQISINFCLSHSKFPEIIFKDYKEFLKVASKGENALCSFFYELWEKIKADLTNETSLEITDKNLRVDRFSFQTMMVNASKNKQILNIVLPAISEYGECKFIALYISKEPKYFTCELSQSFNDAKPDDYYCLGQWEYDKRKDKFIHKDLGRIEDFSLAKFLSEIDKKI